MPVEHLEQIVASPSVIGIDSARLSELEEDSRELTSRAIRESEREDPKKPIDAVYKSFLQPLFEISYQDMANDPTIAARYFGFSNKAALEAELLFRKTLDVSWLEKKLKHLVDSADSSLFHKSKFEGSSGYPVTLRRCAHTASLIGERLVGEFEYERAANFLNRALDYYFESCDEWLSLGHKHDAGKAMIWALDVSRKLYILTRDPAYKHAIPKKCMAVLHKKVNISRFVDYGQSIIDQF